MNHNNNNNDIYHFDMRSNDDKVPNKFVTKSVTIHPSVTEIRDDAFYKCSSLTSIKIPDSVTEIGNWAFHLCDKLTSIDIPNSVTSIGENAFSHCRSITSIKIPDGVTHIGHGAFYKCDSLTLIDIPDGVTHIGDHAFDDCGSLTSIKIPDGVTHIGCWAFKGCCILTLVDIPDSVTEIVYEAFQCCSALQKRNVDGRNYHADTATWLRQRFNNLRLHKAFHRNITTSTDVESINAMIQQHGGKAALTTVDAMGMTPLHVICGNPNASIEMIKAVKDAAPEAASMRNVINQTPFMMLLLSMGRGNCTVVIMVHDEDYDEDYDDYHDYDYKERFEYKWDDFVDQYAQKLRPLSTLLENGLTSDVLEAVMVFGSDKNKAQLVSKLERRNKDSGLLPFMEAAVSSKNQLDVVYKLAMMIRPELLSVESN